MYLNSAIAFGPSASPSKSSRSPPQWHDVHHGQLRPCSCTSYTSNIIAIVNAGAGEQRSSSTPSTASSIPHYLLPVGIDALKGCLVVFERNDQSSSAHRPHCRRARLSAACASSSTSEVRIDTLSNASCQFARISARAGLIALKPLPLASSYGPSSCPRASRTSRKMNAFPALDVVDLEMNFTSCVRCSWLFLLQLLPIATSTPKPC